MIIFYHNFSAGSGSNKGQLEISQSVSQSVMKVLLQLLLYAEQRWVSNCTLKLLCWRVNECLLFHFFAGVQQGEVVFRIWVCTKFIWEVGRSMSSVDSISSKVICSTSSLNSRCMSSVGSISMSSRSSVASGSSEVSEQLATASLANHHPSTYTSCHRHRHHQHHHQGKVHEKRRKRGIPPLLIFLHMVWYGHILLRF